MNRKRLKQAETDFLADHPEGFDDPYFIEVARKHKMDAMVEMAQQRFAPRCFRDADALCDDMVRIVSRSSMVSLFEKPRFRDFVQASDSATRKRLASGLKSLLHGKQERGFNLMLDVLADARLAKWSLMTIIPNYYHPNDEVFVKPTTAKGVIAFFELQDLDYKPRPSWAFYARYRAEILAMKQQVDTRLSPSNAAFSGFLMMTMDPGR